MSIQKSVRTGNQRGAYTRPSLYQEALSLYKLATALGDSATMELAWRDMECALELEADTAPDPAEQLLEPLPENKQPALARSASFGKWRTGGEVQSSPAISRRPMVYGWTPCNERGAA